VVFDIPQGIEWRSKQTHITVTGVDRRPSASGREHPPAA
jgi:hypothetical protein